MGLTDGARPSAWVAGSGRSGTTWLGAMMASAVGGRQVFEPLHPERARAPSSLGLVPRGRPFLSAHRPAPEWRCYVEDLLTGRHANLWTRLGHSRYAQWPRLLMRSLGSGPRIVKAIRSNLAVPWLLERAGLSVVLILRHPCAVVASQRRKGWGDDLGPILRNPELVDRHLPEHASWLRHLESRAERLAARWALETLVPLSFRDHDRLLTVTYEELVSDPVGRVRRILGGLGWPLDRRGLRRLERAAGRTVAGGSRDLSSRERLTSWRDRLSSEETDAVLSVCHRLGVELYAEGLTPAPAQPIPFTM